MVGDGKRVSGKGEAKALHAILLIEDARFDAFVRKLVTADILEATLKSLFKE
ncbi:MAG: hypothetical protein H7840_11105 [Alphaproteobacteria bacterium]